VGYFESDPDQPYVQACLPNATTRIPLSLPAQKTQTLFKTQSSPGGGGYNELRIDDAKGREEISIRAQRDWSELVLNDQSIQVDNQRSVLVGGLSSHELKGEEHHLTHGRIEAANHLVSATAQVHLDSQANVILNGGLSTTLKAGPHCINITPAGIFSSVPILLGVAPVPGMPAAPGLPLSLDKKAAISPPESAANLYSMALAEQLVGDAPIVELCQKPQGKTPMECPLEDCPCASRLRRRAQG